MFRKITNAFQLDSGKHVVKADYFSKNHKNGPLEHVSNTADRKYERASKQLYELFPSSHAPIGNFIKQKAWLQLAIAHEVAESLLLSEAFSAGDYKLALTPKNGGRAAIVFESLLHEDRFGLKFMEGEYNGTRVRVAEMRFKKDASVAQKGLELELGEPLMKAMLRPVTYSEVLAELASVMADKSVSPKKKEKLSYLLSALEAERQGQARMFSEACEGDPKKINEAHKILKNISTAISLLEKAKKELGNGEGTNGNEIAIKQYVSALERWPFPRDAKLASRFYDALSISNQAQLGYISKEYVTRALPLTFGVAAFEYTAIDSLSQLQSLLRLMHAKTPHSKEGALNEKIAQFDAKFTQLFGMITGISREQGEVGKVGGEYDSARWFTKMCSFVNTRRRLLAELSSLEAMADELDHELPYRTQTKKVIVNMAFNLCRIGKEEAELMESFIRHPLVELELKKSSAFKNAPLNDISDRLRVFVKGAKKEAECSQAHLPNKEDGKQQSMNGANGRDRFKQQKAQADKEILDNIDRLREIAPALGDILLADFRRSKAHVGYKQGETLSSSPENHLTRLRIAQRLGELTGKPEYYENVSGYLRDTSKFFSMLWGNNNDSPKERNHVREHMLAIIKPSLYLQEKGFDLVGDPEKQIRQGNTTKKIDVGYYVTSDNGKTVINFEFADLKRKIVLDKGSLFEANHSSFDSEQEEKTIHADIYGQRISLSNFIQKTGIGTREMFRDIYHVATRGPSEFEEMRSDMMNMNMQNARFLSTLVAQSHFHSGNIAAFGEEIVHNLPRMLDPSGENSFATKLKEEYPDFAARAIDAKQFTHQQIARRIVTGLGVNKAYFAQVYIKAVLAEND